MNNENDVRQQEAKKKLEEAFNEKVSITSDIPEKINTPEIVQEVIEEESKKQSKPFISEVFNDLQKEGFDKKEDIVEDNILDNIKFDLNNIDIIKNASDLDLLSNEQYILDNKKVMLVTCCQSAYSAEVTAMKNQEIQNVNDSNVDFYTYKKKLYKTLFNRIENTSVGKMSFNTWLKVTSYFDIETLLYGVYCQTFPYENKYTLRCPRPDCTFSTKGFDVVVNNNTLIEMRGQEEEIYSKIDEIVSRIKNPEDLIKNSHVHTTKRISLDESKIIFDIQIPSVFDYLEKILSNTTEEMAEEFSTTLGLVLFIKNAYIPDLKNYKKTNKLAFFQIEENDTVKLIELVSKLPYYDGLQLAEVINDFTDKLRISYAIKGVACSNCGHDIGEVKLSMEDLLFTVIRQGRREKKD